MCENYELADLYQFNDELLEDNAKRRELCANCERPPFVCLCKFMPTEPIKLGNIKIWIFQHPHELKRPLRTTLILKKCLPIQNFEILVSKIFSIEKFPILKEVYENEHTYVLYPTSRAIDLESLPSKLNSNEEKNSDLHIIVLDGTWTQASSIFLNNPELKQLKQVILNVDFVSEYTIRTQPRDFYLSTLETVALTLSKLENNPQMYVDLVKPLKGLCSYQYDFGERPHKSKEFLIINGLYKKPIAKWKHERLIKNTKLQALCSNQHAQQN